MPKRLRIFFPSAAMLLTDHRGHGEGLIAWNMLCGLVERGHEVVACAREVDLRGSAPFDVIETGFASQWESLEPLGYAHRTARLLRKLGGSRRFDVAHWLFPQGQNEVLFRPIDSTPFVAGPFSLEWPRTSKPARPGDAVRTIARPAFALLHRRSLAAASELFVSVPDAKRVVPAEFRSKVRVLPFGVDTRRFRRTALPESPTVLFAGRLDVAKGIRTLVPAVARLRAVLPDVRVRVAGAGPELGWLRTEIHRMGLDRTIELLGPVPHSETTRLLEASSMLLAPARGEPFGMAVLEAMACGRAVIAHDDAGPSYLLDGGSSNGQARFQLVASRDPEALAHALLRVLRDRERLEAIGEANRARVERNFSLHTMLGSLEEAYLRAAARPR
jgi:glycosyltransferase involved in cell wall biosynthesis